MLSSQDTQVQNWEKVNAAPEDLLGCQPLRYSYVLLRNLVLRDLGNRDMAMFAMADPWRLD